MSVSIYYEFVCSKDLKKSGVLSSIENKWLEFFDGKPYESWCWYEPVLQKRFFLLRTFKYEGSTSIPLDEENGAKAASIALKLLSNLRNAIGGDDWSVSMDDLVIHWNSNKKAFEFR